MYLEDRTCGLYLSCFEWGELPFLAGLQHTSYWYHMLIEFSIDFFGDEILVDFTFFRKSRKLSTKLHLSKDVILEDTYF